ncbi:MAG: hypothetical protein K0S61_569 [Anaerocolumna sp.]|jgi:hypothetical protein|nr:hypothetical protein [Anaerocolumna sp.]
MKDTVFVINNIIEDTGTGEAVRIIYICPDSTFCYTIAMNTDEFRIEKREIRKLEEDFANKIIKRHLDTKRNARTGKTISESDRELMEQSKKIIDYILNICEEPYIYQRTYRGEAVRQAIKEFKVSKTTIYKYLRKYLQGGMTLFSLLPNFCNSGARGKQRKLGNKKVGRPSIASQASKDEEGINISEEIKKIFITVIDKHYRNEKETPLSEVFRIMKSEYFYKVVVIDGKEEKKTLPHYKKPNEQQFRYWCKELTDIVDIIRKRNGETDFLNNSRGLTSSTTNGTFGPEFRAQMDSTEFPPELINRMSNKNIGKATTYHIVDEFSTFIMGLSVIIGKASWDGASLAILNCIEDKVEFCAKYGLVIDPNKWPTSKLPRVILADRGTEYTGYLPQYMQENLRVFIQNTPPRMPSYKPHVEQSFNTTEIKMRTWVPGIGKRGGRRRGDKDPKEAAKLDIEDMTFVCLTLAVHHNNKVIDDHPYAGELIKEGIIPTPANLYLWGQKKFAGGRCDFDKDFVKLNLLRRGTATVEEEGIKFKGAHYLCDRALEENWCTKARIKGSWHVDICYDGRNMDNIYIINEIDNYIDICTIKDDYFFYKSKTVEEIDDYERLKKVNETSIYLDYNDQNDMESNDRLSERIKKATREAGGSAKNSKQMKKDMKESRNEEATSYNREHALRIGEANREQNGSDENETNAGSLESTLSKRLKLLRGGK